MTWEGYYEDVNPVSFDLHLPAYRRALEYLLVRNPSLIESDKSPTVALGGFCPKNKTLESFVAFNKNLFAEKNPRLVALDKNSYPLKFNLLGSDGGVEFVQADLTALPFAPNSIDLLYLDCTTEFMTPKDQESLSVNLKTMLSPEGLALSVYHSLFFKQRKPAVDRKRNKVPLYSYSKGWIEENLGKELRKCYEADCKNGKSCFDLQVYCRKEAGYPLFKGEPFCLDF